jgi:hypothetical protein
MFCFLPQSSIFPTGCTSARRACAVCVCARARAQENHGTLFAGRPLQIHTPQAGGREKQPHKSGTHPKRRKHPPTAFSNPATYSRRPSAAAQAVSCWLNQRLALAHDYRADSIGPPKTGQGSRRTAPCWLHDRARRVAVRNPCTLSPMGVTCLMCVKSVVHNMCAEQSLGCMAAQP